MIGTPTAQRRAFTEAFNPDQLSTFAYGKVQTSARLNAMSVLLPFAEGFICKVARRALREANLKVERHDEVQLLISQELEHTLAHTRYNQALSEAGLYDKELAAALKPLFRAELAKDSLVEQVAMAVALEDFSFVEAAGCILKLVERSGEAARLPNAALRFWYWHWQEEVEHSDVLRSMLAELEPDPAWRLALIREANQRFADAVLPAFQQAVLRNIDLGSGFRPRLALVHELDRSHWGQWWVKRKLRERLLSDAGSVAEAVPEAEALVDMGFLAGCPSLTAHPVYDRFDPVDAPSLPGPSTAEWPARVLWRLASAGALAS